MAAPEAPTQLSFNGRVAAITGGGQGMGREHALLLGSRGARVVVNDLDGESAEETVKAVREAGGEATAVVGSIADRQVAQAIVDAAINTWGRIDIVVNNAGIEVKKTFPEFVDADLSRILGVHVWGTWMLTQIAWPHMQKQNYGRVIIVSSTSITGMPGNAAYTAAKGALLGLGRSLALEGEAHGIHVNLFGPVAGTAIAKQMLEDKSIFQWVTENFPPSATSAAVAWLGHEDCCINGEFITSYGRVVGRIALIHSKGVKCADGQPTPEFVRDNFAGAMDMDEAFFPKSMNEVNDRIVATQTEQAPGGGIRF